jgi:hypothetical protein
MRSGRFQFRGRRRTEVTFLERIIELAVTDLGIKKSCDVGCSCRAWRRTQFDLLVAAAKGDFPRAT